MSFTIKCNKCGHESIVNDGDAKRGEMLEVFPEVFETIDINCENPECYHYITVV